jgi:carboxypeptidase Taq
MAVGKDLSIVEKFQERTRQIADLAGSAATLTWDQETLMPEKGATFRARQISTLAGLRHKLLVDPAFGDLVEAASEQATTPEAKADIREARRQHLKAIKVPGQLVRQLASTSSLAYCAWVDARKQSSFTAFAPWLEKIISLKIQEARCLKLGVTPYDSLLDEYEPGMQESKLSSLFSAIRPQLTSLLHEIRDCTLSKTDLNIRGHYPLEGQAEFGKMVLTAMGFDWKAGRLDVSPHPFCTGLSPHDVRMTTRYDETDFSISFFGMVHECGHALYEQGLDPKRYGLPGNETVSLGIHESQSRLWENLVSRGASFWEFWYPKLKETFPGQLDSVSLDQFLLCMNKVNAGLIRVEADEISYGLHVILRFEIERALLSEELKVKDLEDYWSEQMGEYLGVQPANAAEGVLQDVHWSSGLFGYFPTYLLGTIYATQFYDRAKQEIPHLEKNIAAGSMDSLREWLQSNIYCRGKIHSAAELVMEVTGETLQANQFLEYLSTKYRALYKL